ncbi:hypothetical protein KA405_00730 [Patescibacteria group bacterium]|nr:hypothetical protein [Patescibacteria group bacterium]
MRHERTFVWVHFFLTIKKKVIMSKHLISLLVGVIMVMSACSPESDTALGVGPEPLSPDTTTVSELELSGTVIDPYTAFPRVSGTWNIDLTGFQYVWQSNVPIQWNQTSKYTLTGFCGYPKYTGSTSTTTQSTNLCGPSSLLMALSLVPHSSAVAIPATSSAKPKRLAEFARRYMIFDGSYVFGGYTAIAKLRDLANGLSGKKGEFTNWSSCSSYQNSTASTLSSQPNSPAGRTAIKEFIRSQIQLDRPVIAIVTINPSVPNADYANYFAPSGGIGHMVLITGVTERDESNYYRVRFKDPLSNNSKTYEVNYTTFLNSMVVYTTNYNTLAVKGL